MADKPQLKVTIEFRGVTINDMTVEELKALRDVINQLVGKEVERVVEHHHYPWYSPTIISTTRPVWAISNTTIGDNALRFTGNTANSGNCILGDNAHYTVSLN